MAMDLSELRRDSCLGRRALALAGLAVAVVLVVAATPQLLGPDVRNAVDGLERAQPAWLWLAGASFVGALLCNAWAWRTTILLCGGRIGWLSSAAAYGIGSLANSAAP